MTLKLFYTFQLLGIALFVIGLVFRFGGDQVKEDIRPAFENITVNSYDLYSLINSLAIIFIVAGAVIIVFSIIGFIGAACFVKVALILVSMNRFLKLVLTSKILYD